MLTAIEYLRSGLCVLPAIPTEKRPALAGWKQYQRRLPTEQQVQTWFANAPAMCILAGKVSGYLEMIDFDHEGELFDRWRDLVSTELPALVERLVVERSQSGGRHVIYRCESPIPGNRKLAQRTVVVENAEPVEIAGKRYVPRRIGDQFEITYTLIETRGEGGLFLCDPTPDYQIEQGSLNALPILTEAERGVLIEAACALNETIPPVTRAPARMLDAGRPGDDFNERGDVREVLQRHGWGLVRGGENEYWRRPGKEQGWSATLREGVLYVFSSNAAPFEPDRAYAPFTVYTLLNHDGNFAAAATALRAEGYGQPAGGDVDLSHLVCNGHARSLPSPSAYPDPGPLPTTLLRMPGFVSEVMDHCLETAPYPNTVMAFCGAITLLSFLTGRKIRDPGDNRTNLYLLGLAHSSAGKDWPRKINVRILHEIGQTECVGERFASGEGIQDSLFVNPSILFQTDEIDGILQSINKAKDARHENIMTTLLTLYSCANSVFPMRRKAGKDPPGVIDQPCLTIFGTAIPNHYYEALSERMLTNGFFARMLILECGSRGPGQEPSIRDLPESVLETARWWSEYRPGTGNLQDQHPMPTIVSHTDDARRIFVAVREEAEAEYSQAENRNDPVGTTVWGRVSEHSRKLALLYAASENHLAPEIGRAAAEWAVQLVMHQTRRMLFMAQAHVADTPFHADCLKLMRKLREAPNKTLAHSVLLKRMKIDARAFSEIISTLEQRGDIVIAIRSTAGRPSRCYQLIEGNDYPRETSE